MSFKAIRISHVRRCRAIKANNINSYHFRLYKVNHTRSCHFKSTLRYRLFLYIYIYIYFFFFYTPRHFYLNIGGFSFLRSNLFCRKTHEFTVMSGHTNNTGLNYERIIFCLNFLLISSIS